MPKLTYFVENGENTLSHYGRLGMKWGQHIFTDSDIYNPSNGSAKRIKKGLTRLEKDRVKYIRSEYRPAARKNKAYKALSEVRGTSDDKKRYKQSSKDLADMQKNIDRGRKEIDSLVKKISASGNYSIESKDVQRRYYSGKEWVAISLAPLPLSAYYVSTTGESSKAYKVKKG